MTEITQADRDAAKDYYVESGFVASQKNLITHFARHREQAEQETVAKIVAWLKKENGLCDCFARSEGECACGAWDDYKTVPIERIWQAIEAGEWK